MLSIVVFLVMILVVQPLVLWASCLIVRVKDLKFRRVCLAYLAMTLVSWVFAGISLWVTQLGILAILGLMNIAALVVLLHYLLRTGYGRAAGCMVLNTAIAVGLVLLIRATIVEAFRIPTGSMSPTLLAGDRFLVDKITPHFRQPQRGDVVVYHVEKPVKDIYVKRVFAVAGDRLELQGDTIVLNGQLTPVKKIDAPLPNMPKIEYPLVVPQGKLFVVGDEYERSLDSRTYGYVDIVEVVGFADIIYASAVPPESPYSSTPKDEQTQKPGTIRWERIGRIIH